MEPEYIQINKNEALGAMESLGSARRLQESEKEASVLHVFRSFSSSRPLLEPFGNPGEPMGDLRKFILGMEAT